MMKSKTFEEYGKMTNIGDLFTVSEALDRITETKGLESGGFILTENIILCLEAMRTINVMYIKLETMRSESFDMFNNGHMSLINKLWANLKPDQPRASNSLISSDWAELGFQSNDPSTDFRSMGMLGLYQLVYFSQYRKQSAQTILSEFSTNRSFFPFAIIGINLSRFIFDMFVETRFHRKTLQAFGAYTSDSFQEEHSNDPRCINYCCDVVHDIYCIAFEELYLLWIVRRPPDVMAFNDLFQELQEKIKQTYTPIIT